MQQVTNRPQHRGNIVPLYIVFFTQRVTSLKEIIASILPMRAAAGRISMLVATIYIYICSAAAQLSMRVAPLKGSSLVGNEPTTNPARHSTACVPTLGASILIALLHRLRNYCQNRTPTLLTRHLPLRLCRGLGLGLCLALCLACSSLSWIPVPRRSCLPLFSCHHTP